MPQTLLVPPSYSVGVSIRFDEIIREFGGGYDTNELVGPTDGIILLKYRYNILHAGAQLTINDPEAGGAATSWPKYLWLFYRRRKQQGDAFNVTLLEDPATEAAMTQLFKFADSQLDYDLISWKLYTSGIALRQWRALT